MNMVASVAQSVGETNYIVQQTCHYTGSWKTASSRFQLLDLQESGNARGAETGRQPSNSGSQGFADLDQARTWAMAFIAWYNGEHRYREIGFVTPNQPHSGHSAAILARRREVYEAARLANPARWHRDIRRWAEPDHVWLNKREKETRAV